MGKKMFQPLTTATILIIIFFMAINLKNNQQIMAQQQQEQQLQQHQQRQYYQHHQQQQNGDENCETLPSEIHIIKEEYDELGRLQRTCNGEVQVNKCEGLCNSQVQPSVITPTGFLKECYCCRESFLRERLVTLTHCYDPDGARLTSADVATMDVRLKEPAECRCFKCGDFSR